MKRWSQVLLMASFLPLCWLLMMAVHELGHVLAAGLTEGTVKQVVLHPLAISRTDVDPNPEPLMVVWGGPLMGITLPVLFWGLSVMLKAPAPFLWRFWAGFCLVANGAYIGIGSFDSVGDAGEMLKLGSPIWSLWLFGGITLTSGFWLWHKQGKHFGLGKNGEVVEWSVALATLGLLALILVAEMWLSPVM